MLPFLWMNASNFLSSFPENLIPFKQILLFSPYTLFSTRATRMCMMIIKTNSKLPRRWLIISSFVRLMNLLLRSPIEAPTFTTISLSTWVLLSGCSMNFYEFLFTRTFFFLALSCSFLNFTLKQKEREKVVRKIFAATRQEFWCDSRFSFSCDTVESLRVISRWVLANLWVNQAKETKKSIKFLSHTNT